MTIPYVCILFSLLLIYINKIPVSLAMAKEEGGADNHYPRDQQARLTGIGKRALAAHQNSIEAFPIFAIGVFVSSINHANQSLMTYISVAFVLARIAYSVFYLTDLARFRSIVWTFGLILSVSLYLLPFYS
ncbi:membrane protein [Leptospira kobayashii]|uniref:Membrane protein n=1 Tax=Leptospira kobayashii TaxID=1917830 RepID=A0ABN6KGN0_9LEPT|nr:MAPEG family protein [Leptospira kobayashii]BDA79049.1 membrane protein [Leptospira kobayashii]